MPASLTAEELQRLPASQQDVVRLMAEGLSYQQISESLAISSRAVRCRVCGATSRLGKSRMAELKRQVPSGRGLKRLTRKHGDVIRLRLKGLSFPQIGRQLGIVADAARIRLKHAMPFLHQSTRGRLSAIKAPTSPKRIANAEIDQVVQAFQTVLANRATPKGTVEETMKITSLTRKQVEWRLWLAGINLHGEFQRKTLDLSLRVAETMHDPIKAACASLGVPRTTLKRYRERVAAGDHLRGALEFVGGKADLWWDATLPTVNSKRTGPANINLSMRNRTVEKDLALFDENIRAAKLKVAKHHPDRTGIVKSRAYQEACDLWHRLRRQRERYVEKERTFRETYKFPLHVALT